MEGFFRFPAADEAVKDIDLVAHIMAQDGEPFHAGLYQQHLVLEETDGLLLDFIGTFEKHFRFQIPGLQGHIAVEGPENGEGNESGQKLVHGPQPFIHADGNLDKGDEYGKNGDVVAVGLVIDELPGRYYVAEHMGRKGQEHHEIDEVE